MSIHHKMIVSTKQILISYNIKKMAIFMPCRTHVRMIYYIITTIHSMETGDYNAAIYEKIRTIKWSRGEDYHRSLLI